MGKIQCFHLAIERLLMSGALTQLTELSLYDTLRFHLAIERLLMSGALTQLTELSLYDTLRFHLVIKRLFMAGLANRVFPVNPALVSISLSSGFSFQDAMPATAQVCLMSFNLVIERLLISGANKRVNALSTDSFQSRYRAASHFRSVFERRIKVAAFHVSISLSSGFSFQVIRCHLPDRYPRPFQSRYRAASHFR